MRRAGLLLAGVVLLASACGRGDREQTETPAVAEAVGSGMCVEHGVLEAVCTKCNLRLVPVFQAKGDWCAEHGFPESFCPTCHPEKGGKPDAVVAQDEPPSTGLRVKFRSAETADQAGIETAEARSARDADLIAATARIVPDNARSALVTARMEGVIRSFHAAVGERVRPGVPLATIQSAQVADERAKLSAARAHLRVAEATHARATELHARGIAPIREVQEAEQVLADARAEVAAASAALEMVGTGEAPGGEYELRAPIAGVVTRRELSVGSLVHPEDTIFEILDVSSLWAEIDVPESQAWQISVGQRVELEVDGISDRTFGGTIAYVAPVIDPATRTVRARAAIQNPDAVLKANMFARARIFVQVDAGSALVPRAAVQEVRGTRLVFVPVAADEFETRRVQVRPSDGDLVAVVDGIEAGEYVVTTGSFLLKTETLKGSIGAGCCEVEPGR